MEVGMLLHQAKPPSLSATSSLKASPKLPRRLKNTLPPRWRMIRVLFRSHGLEMSPRIVRYSTVIWIGNNSNIENLVLMFHRPWLAQPFQTKLQQQCQSTIRYPTTSPCLLWLRRVQVKWLDSPLSCSWFRALQWHHRSDKRAAATKFRRITLLQSSSRKNFLESMLNFYVKKEEVRHEILLGFWLLFF